MKYVVFDDLTFVIFPQSMSYDDAIKAFDKAPSSFGTIRPVKGGVGSIYRDSCLFGPMDSTRFIVEGPHCDKNRDEMLINKGLSGC